MVEFIFLGIIRCKTTITTPRPCFFPEKYFSGNHFPHFSMYGKHIES